MPADLVRPIAPPMIIDNVYTGDEYRQLMELARSKGPWDLTVRQFYSSPEGIADTTLGKKLSGAKPTWDDFLQPYFTGYIAKEGICLYPEIEDLFYNKKFLDLGRSYWKADYARPENMIFNINGPTDNFDVGHLDGAEFRGLNLSNTPNWLLNSMIRSDLFKKWQMKKAQVISWFYQGSVGGGFTYWPQGPHEAPERIASPIWNRGIVAETERMYHRGEANGPMDQRSAKGLTIDSTFSADSDSADGWQITTGDLIIKKIPAHEVRMMIHWRADIYMDSAELKQVVEHTDDLTHDQVIDTFISDMRRRGRVFEAPSDPLHDRDFMHLLTEVYDPGVPSIYPAEAPRPGKKSRRSKNNAGDDPVPASTRVGAKRRRPDSVRATGEKA